MEDHTVTRFVVLFTAQKQKKYKTWQDGTMAYYSFNKKLILTDEKGYNIDKKFTKSGIPSEGDEIEFDGHLVAVESLITQEPSTNEPTGPYAPPIQNPTAADHHQETMVKQNKLLGDRESLSLIVCSTINTKRYGHQRLKTIITFASQESDCGQQEG
ncbi:hypothetical protein BX666DRAFT_166301 [Dichotomocladium elegans]|nr:hypothetical protein BX666DRAFT_166301 [Dichotomocladium elegans]